MGPQAAVTVVTPIPSPTNKMTFLARTRALDVPYKDAAFFSPSSL